MVERKHMLREIFWKNWAWRHNKYHDFNQLRLGQAFCNTYIITNPDLYYEKDDEKAAIRIEQYFTDYCWP